MTTSNRTMRCVFMALVGVLGAGCDSLLGGRELNSAYCNAHPDDQDCRREFPDGGSDGPTTCTMDNQCTAPTGVCDTTDTMTCVECTTTQAEACMGTSPICGADHVCHGCSSDDECPSKVCDADTGACASESTVLYTSPTGSGSTCSHASPCKQLATAIGLVNATKQTIRMLAGSYSERITIADKTVTIVGSGADLSASSPDELLHISGSANVSIRGLRIHDGLGTSGDGVLCVNTGSNRPTVELLYTAIDTNGGRGIDATNCALTVGRSHLFGNTAGGVAVNGGSFVVVGNTLFNNGGNASVIGGISITTVQSASNRLEFNSFSKNTTMDGIAPAIQCIAGTFSAHDNIMSGNGTVTQMDQTGGTCTHTYSIARPGTIPPGAGNAGADPLFVNTTTGDLHIQSGSPARHAGDPAGNLSGIAARDIDGDPRVSPPDIGADTIP